MSCIQMLWLKKHMPKELFDDSMFFDLRMLLFNRLTGDSALFIHHGLQPIS